MESLEPFLSHQLYFRYYFLNCVFLISEPYFFKFDTKGWYIHSHALVTVQATVRGYPLVIFGNHFLNGSV